MQRFAIPYIDIYFVHIYLFMFILIGEHAKIIDYYLNRLKPYIKALIA